MADTTKFAPIGEKEVTKAIVEGFSNEFNEYIDRILTDLLEILGSRARPTGLGRRR